MSTVKGQIMHKISNKVIIIGGVSTMWCKQRNASNFILMSIVAAILFFP